MTKNINLTLKVWRQNRSRPKGGFEIYNAKDISTDMSFLEMLDVVNESLIVEKKEPIAFDHDCREGICGTCGAVVDGQAHGPQKETTLCQLHMRHFKNNETIVIEPWRARAFPVVKDLVVDRGALDEIIAAGGYISAKTGGPQDANNILIGKEIADESFNAAACIGCGACVAACPNASAMLFVGAKISHLGLLPQGRPEAKKRVMSMVRAMDRLGFGNCSNETECEIQCPKAISIKNIARMNRDFVKASVS